MIIADHYYIKKQTVLMIGEYDHYGNLFTRVIEGKKSILVKSSPEQIINRSLLHIYGFNLKGALESSKAILGKMNMYPVMVSARHGICLFSTKSRNHSDCVYFSRIHVKRTESIGLKKTKVHLSYGHSIIIDKSRTAFNNRAERASQLIRIISERSENPLAFYKENQQGYLLIKEREKRNYRISKLNDL